MLLAVNKHQQTVSMCESSLTMQLHCMSGLRCAAEHNIVIVMTQLCNVIAGIME
jgi:hypothetical protein